MLKAKRMGKFRVITVFFITLCLILSSHGSLSVLASDASDETKVDLCKETSTCSNLIPDVIDAEEADSNRYVGRIREDEKDLYTLVLRNADGSKTMRVFGHPVKYVNAFGEIEDISLRFSQGADRTYQAQSHPVTISLANHLADGVRLSYENVDVSMFVSSTGARNSEAVLSENGKTVSYAVDEKTSFEYSLTCMGLKEDIVVREYTGQNEFEFILDTNGLHPATIEDSVYLVDKAGEIKATIGDIIVFTADNKNNTLGSISYDVVEENQTYRFIISVDDEYLRDVNTSYPIRIDPTIEIKYSTSGAGAIEDVTINNSTTFSGTLGSLYVGRHSGGSLSRSLMRFPSLNISTIPSPCITSASIELRDLMCQGSENIVVQCCIYNSSAPAWSESGTTTWSSVGTSYCGLILDSHTITYGNGNVSGDNQRYSFNILNLARAWSEGTQSPTKGVVFKANDSFENQTGSDIKKWLKTFASYNRSAYQPSLKIVYEEWPDDGNGGATSITAIGRYVSASKRIYSFVPASSGTYYVETEKPNGVSSQDTVVFLYDSSYHLLAKNDDKSSGITYSKVSYTLTAGQTYHVIITKYPYNPTHNCYLAIYKSGSLFGTVAVYADFVKDFNKIGDYNFNYNCMAYALGDTTQILWPWGENNPTVSQVTTYMQNQGYTQVSTFTSNCVIVYGPSSSSIAHFAKSASGTVTAKMGRLEKVSHPLGYNAYFSGGDYGIPQAYYVKTSSKSDPVDEKEIKFDFDYYSEYWGNQEKQNTVYKIIDEYVLTPTFKSNYDLIPENQLLYEQLSQLGEEAVPYILKYVLEAEDGCGYKGALAVAIANKILRTTIVVSEEELPSGFECQFYEGSPRFFAARRVAAENK